MERSHSTPVDVLLVEDNPGDVRLVREGFDGGSVETTLHVVNDGFEALEFLFRRGEYADAPRPDLVVLDLNLPRKSGEEVLETIRDDPDLEHLPVVILTSSGAESDVERSYELHANAFVTKPVDPELFLDVIETCEEFWCSAVRLPPVGDSS